MGALFAQEADYLRLGMRPDEAASVYTSLRSCSNAPFDEAPGLMSWEGPLYGGYADIELRFGPKGAESIGYRISPSSSASTRAILAAVIADRELAHGPATSKTNEGAAWLLPGIKLSAGLDGTEVVMRLEGSSP
jgi:hypothetical protein